MHLARSRTFLLIAAAAGGLVASLLVVFTLMGSPAPKAQAIFPTTTSTPCFPCPTAKPNGLGNISGLFDIDAGPGLYHCIVRTDEDSVSLEIKTAAQCYTEFATGVGAGEPPCNAQHGTAATPAPVVPGEGNCNGHVDPPPYSPLQPTKLVGVYCPAGPACGVIPGTATAVPGDSLYTVGCFGDIGGSLGPNVVTVTQVLNAKAQDPGVVGTVSNGSAYLTLGATNTQCDAANAGTAPGPLGGATALTLTRRATTRDFDGDGCTDMAELWQDKPGAVTLCGDDPWNPYDPTGASPDVSGSYDIMAEAVRADKCLGGLPAPACTGQPDGTLVPGIYYNCKADIQQSGTNLTGKALCYTDSPSITVNPQVANGSSAAGVVSCPPADVKFCGDGLPGAGPPGCVTVPPIYSTCRTLAGQGTGCPTLPCDVSQYQFADIGLSEAQLSGSVVGNTMTESWCFRYPDFSNQGYEIWVNKIDPNTGIGYDWLYSNQTSANCDARTQTVTLKYKVLARYVRQAPGPESGTCTPNPGPGYSDCRDSDGDGCPDKRELGDTPGGPTGGGLRDPMNRWDMFNPEKVNTPHQQTVADILFVVGKYGKNQGNALYTIDADRTALIGGNVWNLGPPDGQQTVADILAAVKQYNQNC